MTEPERPTPEQELTDGRQDGNWQSRYPCAAWRQIWMELAYLLSVLFLAVVALLIIGCAICNARPNPTANIFGYAFDKGFLKWVCVALSGVIGGACFDLKWLYHSVAKWRWSVDRILWRLIVPFLSGIVAVYLAFLIVSGIVPFLKGDSFKSFPFSLGFGFLFGYFSDSVLAALKKFSEAVFGVTDKTSGG